MGTRKYSDGYRALRDADVLRRITFDVLMQVKRDGAFGNTALAKALRQARQHERIDARNAAFASELVNGTPRRRGRLDAVLARYLAHPIDELDLPVAVLLRLGAHQLLNMCVPDHAAVSTTVDLVWVNLTGGPTRIVNMVLRPITHEKKGVIEEALDQIEDPIERLGALTSHPTWTVEIFSQAFTAHGYFSDELEALLEGDNVTPHVTFVARPGLTKAEELVDEAEEVLDTRVAMGTVSSRAVLIESGDPVVLEPIHSGAARIQDEGSQLSALIAATAPLEGPDVSWLDPYAGPGGRAALLGALARQRQVHLVANELHPHRARPVERVYRRLDNVNTVSSDGRSFGGRNTSWALGSFDRVVIDAPCSGMGSMRRRPESRWCRSQADVGELVILQAQLLCHARGLVRPGGVLTYTAYSPHKEETVDQLGALLSEDGLELPDTVVIAEGLVPMSLEIPEDTGLMAGAKGRSLQLWEHRHGTGLMFIAALRRVEEQSQDDALSCSIVPTTVTISSSILNCGIANLRTELEKISGADVAHVDVMDNHLVPNPSWGLPVAEAVVKSGILPVGAHFMIEDPDRWAPAYAEAGCFLMTFHAEAAHASLRLACELHCLGSKVGLGLKPTTDIAPFVDILSELDMILVMTVEPGFGGQSFIDSIIPKICRTREVIDAPGLEVSIQAGGEVSRRTIELAAEAGADNFAAGSAVFRAEGAYVEVEALRAFAARHQH